MNPSDAARHTQVQVTLTICIKLIHKQEAQLSSAWWEKEHLAVTNLLPR